MDALLKTLKVLLRLIRGLDAEIEETRVENPHDFEEDFMAWFTHDHGTDELHAKRQALTNAYRAAYASLEDALHEYRKCPRCGGEGEIHAYWHVEGGVCFRCGGSGVDPSAPESVDPGVPAPSDI